ncbi:MAG TPA: DUF4255 domain-containing protein [Arachnia sp.]|nr:DUF4255 domain-containing protein [Arachnia sp.]HMR12466.1 DUF4255 domain-containing protein [Arachnia sp.]
MADHRAIATATEVLRRRLSTAIRTEFPGAQVAAKRPEAGDGQAQSQVSVFLYRVTPNAALRNNDLATRDSNGRPVRKPTAALDLHYLLSFTGDEQNHIPQRMLGIAVASLHAAAPLSRAELGAAATDGWVGASDLADDVEFVKFSMSPMTLDDLSKLWSVFLQVPYQLSVVYEASVVTIESDVPVHDALPVQEHGVDAFPIHRPVIESVNGGRPVDGDVTIEIEITGRSLRGDRTLVALDGRPPQLIVPVTDRRIIVPSVIALSLAAGRHTVQVVHELMIGDPRVPHRGTESEVVGFVLRPTITVDHAPGDQEIVVGFMPPVRDGQRIRLLLDELINPVPTDRKLRHVELAPAAATQPAPWATRAFDVSGLDAGTYLLRARVDDAESPMSVRRDGAVEPAHQVSLP